MNYAFDITVKTTPSKSFRNAAIIGKFDLSDDSFIENFKSEFTLPDDWKIGLIVGNSGTGKTTIAKDIFKDYYVEKLSFANDISVADAMPDKISIDDIIKTFNAVGFSSPPSWLKPYGVLSNGQKMRVDLAYSLLNSSEIIVFDEFTSVVDRTVAQVGSYAVQKAVRKHSNKKFVAVSCHADVLEWLLPDWVLNTNEMRFTSIKEKKTAWTTYRDIQNKRSQRMGFV